VQLLFHTLGRGVRRALPLGVLDGPVWQSRELLRALVARNLKMRYKRSVLGFVWALLNPLFTVVILVAVFRFVFRLAVPDYWAFLLSGYFAWIFVLHTVGACASVVRDHSYMTRTLAFPSDVLVLSTVLARFIEFAAELTLVAILLAIFKHHGVPISYVTLPLIAAIHLCMTLALAFPIAALAVFFQDVQHALPVAFTLLGYLSPVYYPLSYIPEHWQGAFRVNPFANVLPLFHRVLYEGQLPSAAATVLTALASVMLLIIGAWLFRWKRGYFAEVV
jgi:lipopolysaccharide transport system permease protein